MDMDHLIGQRFNLISKSEIRYVGTLHEINPENATIALEDVYSYGTENRKTGADFIPASQQKFEYIVFRGSDVKDIKVLEEQKENQHPSPPPNVLNDPAILNASRPPQSGTPSGPPPNRSQNQPPPGYPPHNQFPPNYYNQYGGGRGGFPPPPGGFGPGPGFQGMPYGPPSGQPPPGWFGPPSNPFPPVPGQTQFPLRPVGAPGQRPPSLQQNQQQPAPLQGPPELTSELPAVDEKVHVRLPTHNAAAPSVPPPQVAPTPPVDSKPSVSEALAPKPVPSGSSEPFTSTATTKPPTGPKSGRIQPAVPFPTAPKAAANPNPPIKTTSNGPLAASAGNVKQPSPAAISAPSAAPSKPVANAAGMQEATRAATAAVAAAMAKLSQPPEAQPKKSNDADSALDALTKKVSEIRTSGDGSAPRGRGTPLNHGRGRGAYQNRKIDIPKTDYDFETANAKFNKEDLIKEAIATGSPIGEGTPDGSMNGVGESSALNGSAEARKDSLQSAGVPIYNKSSFFDDISSDLKDREAGQFKVGSNAEGGFNGREKRGEEIRRNIETFGQGSVDGGFRGRGRGRGYRGGYNGRGGGYRGRGGYGYGQQRGYGQRGGYNGPRKADEPGFAQS